MKPHIGGITSIVVHHTESQNEAVAMEQARLRSVRRFHMVDRGCGDVAYHYFVGSSGLVYEGRDFRFAGDSGTSYDIDGRLLICVLGNFTEELPSADALETLVRLVTGKLREHHLTPRAVVTHRMVAATDCPGDALQRWFEGEGAKAIARSFGIAEEVKGGVDNARLSSVEP